MCDLPPTFLISLTTFNEMRLSFLVLLSLQALFTLFAAAQPPWQVPSKRLLLIEPANGAQWVKRSEQIIVWYEVFFGASISRL